ncbi:single-stranded-DNA-specific exonuclease RecJ [Leptolyngbya ohadii]|uniref:single-stranded-DNA-specific exonuclease RecJ n=1 Tax=Leptolyngbya ohadii TaxID=1962290 RepID=UPI000B59B947|nr:single-stranded-DNA-specific exonuclease RecJ [Leptolyngbya ohadii]
MGEMQWRIQTMADVSADFLEAVCQIASEALTDPKANPAANPQSAQVGQRAAQLLWNRGIRSSQSLAGYLNPNQYQPTSPFAFGEEMRQAVDRLIQARQNGEKVAIWGDFDADGITSTAVLWEGLGQFFPSEQLTYVIPNRLTESHGLAIAGMDALNAEGYRLIVTCDTGSTNLTELEYAQQQGIEVIITDHHTLPAKRPPVVAMVNPRTLSPDHPLAYLSGVAVAYKLVEALYETLPDLPTRPLTDLLDLVAIGLIADLVNLTGDCRYLAQRGIEQLQRQRDPKTASRPGVACLLELCQRNGDRPTDISFGLGPRINAISRIRGDARFGVELLTCRELDRCRELAQETELANTRRKSLQKDVVQQIQARLTEIDLSTTSVIVLADSQWSVGVLGLVAGQIAQETNRPTILLTYDETESHPIARGSARSTQNLDLYALFATQSHLIHHFGGHPLAAGLTLPLENLPLFTEAVNRQVRQQQISLSAPTLTADLTVTVAELGKDLFRELKLLEPYGMGNPVPRLLIHSCWFRNVHNANIKDLRGRKIRYIKTEFELWDRTTQQGFPGIWWGHYRDEIPTLPCDAIVELDYNAYRKQYEVRLVDLRLASPAVPQASNLSIDWIIDCRNAEDSPLSYTQTAIEDAIRLTTCPASWDELGQWLRQAQQTQRSLILDYPPPPQDEPIERWRQLVGIAKYLSRTGTAVPPEQICQQLQISFRSFQVGLYLLRQYGFQIGRSDEGISFSLQFGTDLSEADSQANLALQPFLDAVQEEQFQRQYFSQVPLSLIQAIVTNSDFAGEAEVLASEGAL